MSVKTIDVRSSVLEDVFLRSAKQASTASGSKRYVVAGHGGAIAGVYDFNAKPGELVFEVWPGGRVIDWRGRSNPC